MVTQQFMFDALDNDKEYAADVAAYEIGINDRVQVRGTSIQATALTYEHDGLIDVVFDGEMSISVVLATRLEKL